MPKYTARVLILFDGKVDEELLLDNFHASGQLLAERAVGNRATQYVMLQNDNNQKSYGFKVDFCMRTSLLEAMIKKKHLPVISEVTKKLPPPKTVTHITSRVKLTSKFDSEIRGDFNDPFKFHTPLLRSIYDRS